MESPLAERGEDNCYVALTHGYLQVQEIMHRVRSPRAGAIVLFAGTLAELSPPSWPFARLSELSLNFV
jgi:hypothetical protein